MAAVNPVRIYRRGKSYQLYYYTPRGERRRVSAGNDSQQAQRMAVMFSDWLLGGKDPELELEKAREDNRSRYMTLNELFPVFMENHGRYQSDNMVLIYRERFDNIRRCPALANAPISGITTRMVMEYAGARKKQDGVSNATVNREITVIKTMLNRAVEWGMIESNPIVKIRMLPELPKREVDLTVSEAASLIGKLTGSFALVTEYAIYTGFRLDNILSLTIGQVRFHDIGETGEVRLRVKGGRWQTFPVGPNAVNVLKRAICDRTEGFVFLNPRTGTRYTSVSDSFRRAVRKLDLKVGDSYLRFHDLRHVFATWLHREGVSLDVLRVLLGHRDRATTDRYTTASALGAGKVLSLMPKIESPGSRKTGAV